MSIDSFGLFTIIEKMFVDEKGFYTIETEFIIVKGSNIKECYELIVEAFKEKLNEDIYGELEKRM